MKKITQEDMEKLTRISRGITQGTISMDDLVLVVNSLPSLLVIAEDKTGIKVEL